MTLLPKVVAEIDFGRLKGKVRQLAWSPDAEQLYLQTYEPNPDATVKSLFHYLIPVSGGDPNAVDAPPDWAVEYLRWKSAQTSPDDPSFKIELEQSKKKTTATATPMAGDMARGGTTDPTSGTTAESVISAAQQTQSVNVVTMRLKGEVVGEWVNQPIIPGLTFGWGPSGTGLIAFSEKNKGQLLIMDRSGAKQKVDGTKSVVTPAWSADGGRLAYLEARGGKKYALVIADVHR